jgi:hypothetical protein
MRVTSQFPRSHRPIEFGEMLDPAEVVMVRGE